MAMSLTWARHVLGPGPDIHRCHPPVTVTSQPLHDDDDDNDNNDNKRIPYTAEAPRSLQLYPALAASTSEGCYQTDGLQRRAMAVPRLQDTFGSRRARAVTEWGALHP
ncbi:uncharacterized protein SETTUDRAFT_21050 [Exserohilum turcica Et28A]|uniref:Uncharacterized protein n=1 Tax=Exserohilum turcicum (strain 28A) TaxID=671987 RepID=R0K5V9_EXST2|nr:uncharacterized protein SETTUDRAFT_21050 [Exserohilum turcica Et28A]EOA83697.1 hypothetical protein SETTUDRAFT_21050 [Exserohilum turcica Et28A]